MAGTKSVMDACLLQNKIHLNLFQGRHPLCLQHPVQLQPRLVRYSSSNAKFIWRHMGKQIATVKSTLAEGEPKEEAISELRSNHGIKLTATVSVRNNNDNKVFANEMVNNFLSLFGGQSEQNRVGLVLQLVSTQLHPRSKKAKLSKETVLELYEEHRHESDGKIRNYKVEFTVDSDFGVPGAVTVVSGYDSELFLESINIAQINVHFACKSWVQPYKLHPEKRIFFVNKAYLPSETPNGVKEMRKRELRQLRGDGKGRRKFGERIYDYDIYNDLGDADNKGLEYARPTLHPHPTRCRTGRPPTRADAKAESKTSESESIYVPRDEEFEDIKQETIDQRKLIALFRNVVPRLIDNIMGSQALLLIDNFIKDHGTIESKSQLDLSAILSLNPPILSQVLLNLGGAMEEFFKFESPKIFSREKSHFLQDDEFGRQVLAGLNPLSIERLKVFPPVSKLDPSIYGSVESSIKEEHIIGHIEGMSIQQALEENKLYILDYHDLYLPLLDRINALDGRKAYATTTIFFLTKMGTLKPIAIQLALPTSDRNIAFKQVLTPSVDDTSKWIWQLAKAHVCSNDFGVHTLVHHWLRIHACIEPLIISAHRQLSVMHPIFKLLQPHMRYTIKANATTRELLINAGGTTETNYTSGKYSMEITCAAYKDWWRFDLEGLPSDLIRRGMAVPDATQPNGIRLLIEDYPYANDGLLIWSSIEKLVQTYVNHYYKGSNVISSDNELQSWYKEFINLGHTYHKNATWWPKLATPEDLISILTTTIWIVSAQHAILNFGQYPYGGYVPMRPPLMRKLIPKEGDPEYSHFVKDPQNYFLSSMPSLFQATRFMAVINIGAAHSPDEEYIGERNDLSAWLGEPEIIGAFNQFSMEIKNIEIEIQKRNSDPTLRNRRGVGLPPYELFMPSSTSGATGRGIPNSVTA